MRQGSSPVASKSPSLPARFQAAAHLIASHWFQHNPRRQTSPGRKPGWSDLQLPANCRQSGFGSTAGRTDPPELAWPSPWVEGLQLHHRIDFLHIFDWFAQDCAWCFFFHYLSLLNLFWNRMRGTEVFEEVTQLMPPPQCPSTPTRRGGREEKH